MPTLKKRLLSLKLSIFKPDQIGVIGVSGALLALSSCASRPAILIASGSQGSGYQRISEQVITSANRVGGMQLSDDFNSPGSRDNLERLLNGEVDFALLQLDVAREAMRERQVQAVVVLAQETLQIITRADAAVRSFADLEGKRVAIGATGSGIAFTSERLFAATDVAVRAERSGLEDAFTQLRAGQLDAVVYVGPLGTNEIVRKQLTLDTELELIGLESNVINYLTIQFPESYQSAVIPQGSYGAIPPQPRQNRATISTATALVTRPDVDQRIVSLLAWSILSTARRYAPFYPQLAQGDAETLLRMGLVYMHPGAVQALENGDPRVAWLRYIQGNAPLQAALIMLTSTSAIGFLLRWWRKRRSADVIKTTRQSIAELRILSEESPQRALSNVEQLRQQHRLMLIDGALTTEVYERVERMTRVLADQCRTWQQQQRRESSQETLKLLDDWQIRLRHNPQDGLKQINQVEHQFRERLLANEVDIETYILIRQLTLLLIMSLVPQTLLNNPQSSNTVSQEEPKTSS
ncbi:MAG: TAXI family TRAP transporter solute-binding subunit [Cyanophyceae cyanobacterium]